MPFVGSRAYERALRFSLGPQIEGGISDHPNDDGGFTNRGVTQRTYDHYRLLHGKPKRSVAEIEDDEIRDLYWTQFWIPARCLSLPELVAVAHFDAAINLGPDPAAEVLQGVLGVKVDAQIGPKTLAAVNSFVSANKTSDLAVKIIYARIGWYVNEVRNERDDRVFLNGWLDRCRLLLKEISK